MAQAETVVAGTRHRFLPSYFTHTFGMVWTGITLSAVGDGFATVALGLWVLQATGSAMAMSQIMLVRSIVGIVVGPISGGLVDRFDRQRLMVVSDLVRTAIFVAIAWLMVVSPTVPMLPLMALLGLSTIFTVMFDTGMAASTIMIVGREEVPRAQGMMSFTNMGARIFGPVLGGIVIKLFGGPSGMGINAASFLVSAVCLTLAGRIPSPDRQMAPGSAKPSLWAEVGGGFRFLRQDALTAALVLFLGPLIMFFSTGLSVLLPVVAVKVWNADGPLYGTVQAVNAAGFSVGFLILMLKGHKLRFRGMLFGAMMGVAGLLMAAVALLPSALPALPILFLLGLALALGNAINQVALQQKVPPEMQGRVMGVAQTMFNVAMPVGMVLVGLLADRVGSMTVMLASGIGVAAVGLSAFAIGPVRRFN